MVLVERRVRDRDLPLSEGVVERVVEELGCDAEPGGRRAVDDERSLEPPVLLVAVEVGHLAEPAQRLGDAGSPRVQLVEVVALERVLILGIAGHPADAEVLDGLEVRRRARHPGELAAQSRDHLVGADPPFPEQLELDEHTPGVPGGPASAAGEPHHAFHGGIGLDDVDDRP